MSWRHRISLAVLVVLTVAPLSGTVCSLLCDSAAAAGTTAHHGSEAPCADEPATSPAPGPHMRGTSGHDCSDHDAATRLAVATTATRVDSLPGPFLLAAVPVDGSIGTHAAADAGLHYRTPPGSTPPTAAPLALRV